MILLFSFLISSRLHNLWEKEAIFDRSDSEMWNSLPDFNCIGSVFCNSCLLSYVRNSGFGYYCESKPFCSGALITMYGAVLLCGNEFALFACPVYLLHVITSVRYFSFQPLQFAEANLFHCETDSAILNGR